MLPHLLLWCCTGQCEVLPDFVLKAISSFDWPFRLVCQPSVRLSTLYNLKKQSKCPIFFSLINHLNEANLYYRYQSYTNTETSRHCHIYNYQALPRCNNSWAIAHPIPVPPPVTIAVFPTNKPDRNTLDTLAAAIFSPLKRNTRWHKYQTFPKMYQHLGHLISSLRTRYLQSLTPVSPGWKYVHRGVEYCKSGTGVPGNLCFLKGVCS